MYYYEVKASRHDSDITHHEFAILARKQDATVLREELQSNYHNVKVRPLTKKQYNTLVNKD